MVTYRGMRNVSLQHVFGKPWPPLLHRVAHLQPCAARRPFSPVNPCHRGWRDSARLHSAHTCAAVAQKTEADAHIQLATALLPK
jgi:hypothetical protein